MGRNETTGSSEEQDMTWGKQWDFDQMEAPRSESPRNIREWVSHAWSKVRFRRLFTYEEVEDLISEIWLREAISSD